MEEGVFVGWLKQDGDFVKAGEPLFTLENEKASQDVESTDSGILKIPPDAPKSGATVKVGCRLGYLVAEGETLPVNKPPTPPVSARPTITDASSSSIAANAELKLATPSSSQIPSSPRARRAARELGVDISSLPVTGKGGRIRERDVLAAAKRPSPTRELPVTALRRTIAERMINSVSRTAPVTLTCRADATNLVALRNQFKSTAGDSPVPSYTDIVAKLVAVALRSHPVLAGRWEGERIVLPDAIHIGIAVDTEHGLLVPVVRHVADLPLLELGRRSRDLIEATRSRRVKPEDLQGGNFTITNLGGFGIDAFTPIINYPETAVLGLGAIRREPAVLDDGSLASREQITLSLTFDHRVVDGAPAARFLQTLCQGIENPTDWLSPETRNSKS